MKSKVRSLRSFSRLMMRLIVITRGCERPSVFLTFAVSSPHCLCFLLFPPFPFLFFLTSCCLSFFLFHFFSCFFLLLIYPNLRAILNLSFSHYLAFSSFLPIHIPSPSSITILIFTSSLPTQPSTPSPSPSPSQPHSHHIHSPDINFHSYSHPNPHPHLLHLPIDLSLTLTLTLATLPHSYPHPLHLDTLNSHGWLQVR